MASTTPTKKRRRPRKRNQIAPEEGYSLAAGPFPSSKPSHLDPLPFRAAPPDSLFAKPPSRPALAAEPPPQQSEKLKRGLSISKPASTRAPSASPSPLGSIREVQEDPKNASQNFFSEKRVPILGSGLNALAHDAVTISEKRRLRKLGEYLWRELKVKPRQDASDLEEVVAKIFGDERDGDYGDSSDSDASTFDPQVADVENDKKKLDKIKVNHALKNQMLSEIFDFLDKDFNASLDVEEMSTGLFMICEQLLYPFFYNSNVFPDDVTTEKNFQLLMRLLVQQMTELNLLNNTSDDPNMELKTLRKNMEIILGMLGDMFIRDGIKHKILLKFFSSIQIKDTNDTKQTLKSAILSRKCLNKQDSSIEQFLSKPIFSRKINKVKLNRFLFHIQLGTSWLFDKLISSELLHGDEDEDSLCAMIINFAVKCASAPLNFLAMVLFLPFYAFLIQPKVLSFALPSLCCCCKAGRSKEKGYFVIALIFQLLSFILLATYLLYDQDGALKQHFSVLEVALPVAFWTMAGAGFFFLNFFRHSTDVTEELYSRALMNLADIEVRSEKKDNLKPTKVVANSSSLELKATLLGRRTTKTANTQFGGSGQSSLRSTANNFSPRGYSQSFHPKRQSVFATLAKEAKRLRSERRRIPCCRSTDTNDHLTFDQSLDDLSKQEILEKTVSGYAWTELLDNSDESTSAHRFYYILETIIAIIHVSLPAIVRFFEGQGPLEAVFGINDTQHFVSVISIMVSFSFVLVLMHTLVAMIRFYSKQARFLKRLGAVLFCRDAFRMGLKWYLNLENIKVLEFWRLVRYQKRLGTSVNRNYLIQFMLGITTLTMLTYLIVVTLTILFQGEIKSEDGMFLLISGYDALVISVCIGLVFVNVARCNDIGLNGHRKKLATALRKFSSDKMAARNNAGTFCTHTGSVDSNFVDQKTHMIMASKQRSDRTSMTFTTSHGKQGVVKTFSECKECRFCELWMERELQHMATFE